MMIYLFRQPEIKATCRDFMFRRFFAGADKSPHLSETVKEAYTKYCHDFLGTDLQDKVRRLFDEERCLIQIDSHWKSVFVKAGHVVVRIIYLFKTVLFILNTSQT